MHSDRSHIHHRLIDSGFDQRQSVLILYIAASLMGILAVQVSTSGAGKALMVLIAVVVLGCVGLAVLTRSDTIHARKAAEKMDEAKDGHDEQTEDPKDTVPPGR